MHATRIALALAVALCGAAQANARTFTQINYPAATQTYVFALNNSRAFVGEFTDAAGNHAFTGQGETLLPVDPGGPVGTSPSSAAYSINNAGQIAGAFHDAANTAHGYVLTGTSLQQIDYPGATSTWAFGVNDTGTIIGIYLDAAGAQHAYLLGGAHLQNIDLPLTGITTPFSINNRGEIVGEYQENANVIGHGFIRRPNGAYRLLDAQGAPPDSTFLISINNANRLVGAYNDANGVQNNFLLRGGHQHPVNVPPSYNASYVSAQTINDTADLVGYYQDSAGAAHGFIAVK
jgi:uncharacterized membrane protein